MESFGTTGRGRVTFCKLGYTYYIKKGKFVNCLLLNNLNEDIPSHTPWYLTCTVPNCSGIANLME